ncbi:hypothetical protein DSO57_1007785 [Entomophthora muscae]|uniref:Uncharacterized protein n=1 Tax=Entomophthora muscae TaxID=34485 RepID=A0ACC2RM16_9FUNG|nr:hypothetical protein DSO57_1007785 [Entomophthora muscae]
MQLHDSRERFFQHNQAHPDELIVALKGSDDAAKLGLKACPLKNSVPDKKIPFTDQIKPPCMINIRVGELLIKYSE